MVDGSSVRQPANTTVRETKTINALRMIVSRVVQRLPLKRLAHPRAPRGGDRKGTTTTVQSSRSDKASEIKWQNGSKRGSARPVQPARCSIPTGAEATPGLKPLLLRLCVLDSVLLGVGCSGGCIVALAGEVEEAAQTVIETAHNVETTAGALSHHETDATIETPEAVDALETTKVETEVDRRGTETIGNGEATASERDVVTTDEVVDRSSEERPKETSVAQRENDRGTHTTAPRGISEPPVGLSEKTSEWT